MNSRSILATEGCRSISLSPFLVLRKSCIWPCHAFLQMWIREPFGETFGISMPRASPKRNPDAAQLGVIWPQDFLNLGGFDAPRACAEGCVGATRLVFLRGDLSYSRGSMASRCLGRLWRLHDAEPLRHARCFPVDRRA